MNPQPGDINYELYKIMNDFKKNKKNLLFFLGAILIGFIGFTSFYTVEPDEEAVVLRLGRYITTTPPGLHFKIPLGIDNVTKVKTKIVHQAEFGFRTKGIDFSKTIYSPKNYDVESLMLTGDLNVAEVQWVVQYQISDPYKYLFQTNSPERNIRDISESIMRRVVGDKMVTDVLTIGRVEIAGDVKSLIQDLLTRYDMGINVTTVKLQDVNPPSTVQPSFNEVNAAKQEQEKLINQAEESYNTIIPEARGKAKKVISEASGYATQIVNEAMGDAARFEAIFKEYQKAPQITRKRLFIDTMEQIFSNIENLTIVDPKVKGVLPLFNNSKALKK